MITNVESNNQENFKTVNGIGLYKISYEMDLSSKNENSRPNYIAGIIAYDSDEAVDTLVNFCKKKVRGFKGIKINELAFEGLCHEISNNVKNVIIKNAVKEGKVVATEAHQEVLDEMEKTAKKQARVKKSIIPKGQE